MDGCYCDYDTEGPSAFSESKVKARKNHKCSECGGAILVGETYQKTWGVWDSEVRTYKCCADCLEMQAWAEAHVKCMCWVYGKTHLTMLDVMDEWDHECPGLYAEAKQKSADIRTKRRALLPVVSSAPSEG